MLGGTSSAQTALRQAAAQRALLVGAAADASESSPDELHPFRRAISDNIGSSPASLRFHSDYLKSSRTRTTNQGRLRNRSLRSVKTPLLRTEKSAIQDSCSASSTPGMVPSHVSSPCIF